jgi:hypothetical protein
MIYFIEDRMHLILFPKNISLDKFIQNTKVKKDSYLGRLFSNLYNAMIQATFDLKSEYSQFYKKEYTDFKEFLHKKYPRLNNEQVKEIFHFLDTGEYTLGKGYMKAFSDYNLKVLIDYDDDFWANVKTLLSSEKYEN